MSIKDAVAEWLAPSGPWSGKRVVFGTGGRRDEPICRVTRVHPDGSADTELTDHGRNLFGPNFTLKLLLPLESVINLPTYIAESADTPHVVTAPAG